MEGRRKGERERGSEGEREGGREGESGSRLRRTRSSGITSRTRYWGGGGVGEGGLREQGFYSLATNHSGSPISRAKKQIAQIVRPLQHLPDKAIFRAMGAARAVRHTSCPAKTRIVVAPSSQPTMSFAHFKTPFGAIGAARAAGNTSCSAKTRIVPAASSPSHPLFSFAHFRNTWHSASSGMTWSEIILALGMPVSDTRSLLLLNGSVHRTLLTWSGALMMWLCDTMHKKKC